MSYVTTVVIVGAYIPGEARAVLKEGYVDAGDRRVWFGELSALGADNEPNPWDHWGGTKGPESDVFGGAFNYLDLDELKAWLETVPWHEDVAVVWVTENTEGFEMWKFGRSRNAEENG